MVGSCHIMNSIGDWTSWDCLLVVIVPERLSGALFMDLGRLEQKSTELSRMQHHQPIANFRALCIAVEATSSSYRPKQSPLVLHLDCTAEQSQDWPTQWSSRSRDLMASHVVVSCYASRTCAWKVLSVGKNPQKLDYPTIPSV